MAMIKFEATRLVGTGKAGKLAPDADGYYTVVLGGLNTLNSAKQYYVAEGAKELFKASSAFIRRVQNGCLKIEVEHPSRLSGMTDDQFIERLLKIDLNNVCGHISEVWLDEDFGKNHPEFNNPELIAIMGKVKPSGAKASVLQSALDNTKENVCFSIRAFTRNFYARGRTCRELETIVTFDHVNEGGITAASKWSSPGLENMIEGRITETQIRKFLDRNETVAMEDSKDIALEVLNNCFVSKRSATKQPLYTIW